ncbi:MAG TPA: hypothetical protein VJN70_06575 [Gemmatimonadaceae bacterium]|nr:hypothetical protein [Gemmatimonadaceae bacterium]
MLAGRSVWLRCLTTLTALLLVGACGSDSTQTQVSEAGTYHLTNVNGQSLPVTITGTTLGTVVIQSASLVLTSGSPSTFTATINGTAGGSATTTLVSAGGTYVRSGSSLTLTATGVAIPFTGTIDNNGNVVVAVPGQVIGTTGTLQLGLAKS